MPTLPEEEQMFTSKMDGKAVWVIEDGDASRFCIRKIIS